MEKDAEQRPFCIWLNELSCSINNKILVDKGVNKL